MEGQRNDNDKSSRTLERRTEHKQVIRRINNL